MKTIGVAKFRQQCLALLDNLDAEGLIVTKRGKPVARVIPYHQPCADLIGSLRHKIKIRGDLFATGVVWDADVPSGRAYSCPPGSQRVLGSRD